VISVVGSFSLKTEGGDRAEMENKKLFLFAVRLINFINRERSFVEEFPSEVKWETCHYLVQSVDE
jgi:hypothetical protein